MSVSEAEIISEGGAPARSRADTHRRLVEAATELFASEGLHGVTSARIARTAGVATGTFYLHFKDKQSLFREIVFAALAELRRRQERAAQCVAGDLRAVLRARTGELLDFAAENRNLVRVVFGAEHASAEVEEEVFEAIVPGIEDGLRSRIARGEAPAELDPAVAAQALAAMTTRVIAWWVEDPSRASRSAVIDTLLRMHPIPSDRSVA